MGVGCNDMLPKNRVWEGKNSNFTVEKPGRSHLHRVSKVNISSNKSCWCPQSLLYDAMRRVLDLCGILSKNPQPQSGHEKIWDKLKNVLQNTYSSKWSRSWETRKDWVGVTSQKIVEVWLNTQWYPGLNSGTEKGPVLEKLVKSKWSVEFN